MDGAGHAAIQRESRAADEVDRHTDAVGRIFDQKPQAGAVSAIILDVLWDTIHCRGEA